MRRFFIAFLVATLFAEPSIAQGQSKPVAGDTVYGLLRDCRMTNPTEIQELMDWAGCRSYIAGIRDVAHVLGYAIQQEKIAAAIKEYGFCSTTQLPLDAYIQVFINWAQAHPEKWANHKIWALFSFSEKWPCE